MASSSHNPHHLHPQHHQLLLQQHQQHQQQQQQQQQQQHHAVHHQQQQRPSTKQPNHPINPSPSPVMPYLAAAAAPSNPSSSSSSPAAHASEPQDHERPVKRQRTNASNMKFPPQAVNVAHPQQQQQIHQRHHQQPKTDPPPQPTIVQPPPPPPPPPPAAPPAVTSPVSATSSSSVPFLRVQEQGSSETFALPLAAVSNWDTLVTVLRELFAKPPHSTPKLKTHRGDTIIKPLIKHFLKDGVHLSVAFDDHAPPHPQQQTVVVPQPVVQAPQQTHVPAPPQLQQQQQQQQQSHHPSPVPPPLTITASNLNPGISASNTNGNVNGVNGGGGPGGGNSNSNNNNGGGGNANGIIPSPTFPSQPLPPAQNPPTPYSPPLHTSSTPSTQSSSPLTSISAGLSFPAPAPAATQIPMYKMSRSLSTVAGLWQEWKQGLGTEPSVESLEARYGPKWRTSQAERKFYSRRKVIIEEITKRISTGMEAWRAVEEVEEVRGGKSLDGLSKMIVERRKSAVGGGQGGRGRGRIGAPQGQGAQEEDDEDDNWQTMG
ncbi:uncharacterized protein H6S33_006330 [Morchella sextelata]|uniref:uncharacterized protein n=1 Tax=Morchella sextelata TaxID=1174677 RepID=UPI001D04355A|nr:uncharacterized protein H6S33_006330 [Morchella sextelata]KAH0604662.1 hypothetical protein H6S33_006330 [Morchella sextelata]